MSYMLLTMFLWIISITYMMKERLNYFLCVSVSLCVFGFMFLYDFA